MTTFADIAFTGICAFVPAEGDRPFAAVFPNGSGHDPEHGVWLLIEKKEGWTFECTDSSRIGTPPSDDAAKAAKYWFVRFVNETIRMQNLVDTSVEREPTATTDTKPNDSTASSLHWVAKTGEFWPGHVLRADATGMPSSGTFVRARTEIPGGKLRTGYVEDAVWKVGPREASMAEEVALNVEFDGDIMLTATLYGATDPVTFTLHGSGTPPPIVIGNTPDADVLPSSDGDQDQDPHFAIFKAIFEPTSDQFPKPKRLEKTKKKFKTKAPREAVADRFRENLERVSGGNCPPIFVE